MTGGLRRSRIALGLLLILAGPVYAEEIPAMEKRSGLDFVSPETRNLQADDMSNPGMLWIIEGERLWREPVETSGASCQGCHGDAAKGMRGVAARYPVFGEETKSPVDLQGRINGCRRERQKAPAFAFESEELVALTAYVAHQSRGMPIAPAQDNRLSPFVENGRKLFQQRFGQLDLSCASCHDEHWGKRLSSSPIPQAHPTAYPLYRLEWQTLGSLQRRLRNCMIGMRAEPFPYGSSELVELELYLMSRAAGLPLETPGVRP